MQYYKNGFYPGDPTIPPAVREHARGPLTDGAEVDVLVIGSGPAGLVLATQLAQFPGVDTRIVERSQGPLQLGQADGIACRSMEMFQAFGFAAPILEEAYWVNETTFWRPDPSDRGKIVRTDRVQDVEDGLSEMPHVIMNQARVQQYLLHAMERAASPLVPDYGMEFVGLRVADDGDYPVAVSLKRHPDEDEVTIRAKYVVGCDGARSGVRAAIGRTLSGDRANHAWGVMDILARTNFPDVRFKTSIQSERGNILLIPREGGYLVRLYVDLGSVTEENRNTIRAMSADEIAGIANDVLPPYSLEIRETVWCSVYEVAQRIADGFDDAVGRGRQPHVFIAGDACHTHSAKAGQGMNVSMQDAFNLGWKLAAVLESRSDPELLMTYDAERRPIAQELIDFDRDWSALLAAPSGAVAPSDGAAMVGPDLVSEYFVQHGRYTAGVAARYSPSLLTSAGAHQQIAAGYPVGMRFHSAPVIRVADGKRVELGHAATADGRWRLYAFADASEERFRALADWLLTDPSSPVAIDRACGADLDTSLDVRGVLQAPTHDVMLAGLPEVLLPVVGTLRLVDYEKVFTADHGAGSDVFTLRGVDREQGALILVRPDQYVADVLPLDDFAQLAAFFQVHFAKQTTSSSA